MHNDVEWGADWRKWARLFRMGADGADRRALNRPFSSAHSMGGNRARV
ncbi:MAG: hypothetical protein ACRBBK_08865 [Paracoccaceae bacterium]